MPIIISIDIYGGEVIANASAQNATVEEFLLLIHSQGTLFSKISEKIVKEKFGNVIKYKEPKI